MKSPVAVPIWCRKRNFFSTMEAKSRFHSLYGAKEEKREIFSSINLANSTFRSLYDVKRRLCFLQQIRLSCPYMVWKEENEAIFAKMHRSICTNSVKGNFFFQLFFDNWIKRSDTLNRQRAVEADTPRPYSLPCKRAKTICVHRKGLSPFPAMTCPVW